MKSLNKSPVFFLILSIIIINVVIWFGIFQERYTGRLAISFLDVGQGDAIFIQAPNGTQVLIDAGSGKKILSELGAVMPFFDKTIDLIMISNPDQDHIGGFVDVLDRFHVDYVMEPGTISKSGIYQAVKGAIEKEGSKKYLARRGMNLVLDKEKGVYIQILFPDKDVSKLSPNDGSLVARLVYGNTSVLLEGDAPQKVEEYLLSLSEEDIDSDIIKIGHHGSKTSTSERYLSVASPLFAIISVGENNRYDHPDSEVLNLLNSTGIQVLRTDKDGRITFISNGNRLWIHEKLFGIF